MPADLRDALKKNKKGAGRVRGVQSESPPGIRGVDHRGETGGDTERRVAQTVEWLADGKSRHWNIQRK